MMVMILLNQMLMVLMMNTDEPDQDEMIYELGPFELSDYPELTG